MTHFYIYAIYITPSCCLAFAGCLFGGGGNSWPPYVGDCLMFDRKVGMRDEGGVFVIPWGI